MRKPEWIIRAGKAMAMGTGAVALMALLTGCPPPEEREPAPPPAPEEQPPPQSPQE